MGKWFLLIFLGLPIVEIALFVEIGGLIGVWATLAWVLLAAVAGVTLIRVQGMQTLATLAASLETGRDPVGIAHGALILVAGFLLAIPGFFTDAVALLLLLPPVRAVLIRRGASRFTVRAAGYVRPNRAWAPPETIDVDYEVVEDPGPAVRGRSGWTRRD